eukprot:3721479-Prymnesium_polylepis.1
MAALVNAQEDAAQYRAEYDRIQLEGQKLYTTYNTKCERLKMMGAEMGRVRAAAAAEEAEHAAESRELHAQAAALQAH